MSVLENTPLGLPLPHPENDPRNTDVPRIRAALTMVDGFIASLQQGQAERLTEPQVTALITAAINALVGGAPAALDTIYELAARVSDNTDAAAAFVQALAEKADAATVNAALAGKADISSVWDKVTPLATANLNDVRTSGAYGQPVAASATVARNYPFEGVPGALEVLVLDYATTPYPITTQRYTTNEGTQRIAIRRGGAAGGWSAWREVPIDGGTILTGKANADLSNVAQATARTKVGTGTMAYRDLIVSSSDPSGTYPNGTIWIRPED
ncbi:pyocin knob domain-containing protein [Pseudorhizobium flavum]|uniref:pyocin knob domain-containing protein n=1 Tax=Pseudorhizobium flavum TaxID=1335061 RepID=UPI002492AE5E|nr:pyocin knob domain-containing protein [Pseudorhizobium flavum]